MNLIHYNDLFVAGKKPVLGVIHLQALPGSPVFDGNMQAVFDHAIAEAEIYRDQGVDGIIVENFRDAPFFPEQVPAETVASMSAVVREVVNRVKVPVGVNVLRNDAHAALAVAVSTGASFIRVNVHTGAVLADQGVIQGKAAHTLRLRAALRARVLITADVGVKHAVPLAPYGLGLETRDLTERGMADVVIVSGTGTGQATDLGDLALVRENTHLPIWIGSGTTPETLPGLAQYADGFIVGSYFKQGGKVLNPIAPERIQSLIQLSRNF
jgi:hypothetical protein